MRTAEFQKLLGELGQLDSGQRAAAIGARDAAQIAAEAGFAAVRGLEMNLLIRPGMDLSRIGALVTSREITVMNIPGIAANGFRTLTTAESAFTGAIIGGGVESGSIST